MRLRLLVVFAFAACSSSKKSTPPTLLEKPSATTAFLIDSSTDLITSQLDALDVSTHALNNVLPASVYPSQSLIRTFSHNLYVVGQDSFGSNNNLLVLSPDSNYAPACGASITACQFALPALFDAQDFWVVSAHEMYVTPYMTVDGTGAAGSASNFVYLVDPLTGVLTTKIDIAQGVRGLAPSLGGEDLLATGDQTINPSAMYAVDNHLFVALDLLVAGPADPANPEYVPQVPEKTSDACGYRSGRVVVIDTVSNAVIASIKLSGANPQVPFVAETGTTNLLIATPGDLGTFDQEPCNGIDRIDTETLTSKGLAVSEAQMSGGDTHGGTVFSFDVDDKGNGLAFIGNGNTNAPDYQLVSFNLTKGFVSQIEDAGVKGLLSYGFIVANPAAQAYVSLPYEASPAVYVYDIEKAGLIDTLPLATPATGVAFYPGPAFSPLAAANR